jgi:hypothetical protein
MGEYSGRQGLGRRLGLALLSAMVWAGCEEHQGAPAFVLQVADTDAAVQSDASDAALAKARRLRGQALTAMAEQNAYKPDESRALELFEQSCNNGSAQGCAEAQEILEGQHLKGLPRNLRPPLTRFPDAARRLSHVVQRQCQLAPRGWPQARACEAAGLMLAETDAARARRAFNKSCRAAPGLVAHCESTWNKLVDDLTSLPAACRAGQPRACFELGRNLWRIGKRTRAAEAFQQECQLRGLTNAFVEPAPQQAGVQQHKRGSTSPPSPLPDSAGPHAHCVNEYATRTFQSWHPEAPGTAPGAKRDVSEQTEALAAAFTGSAPGPVSAKAAKGKLKIGTVSVEGPLQAAELRKAVGRLTGRLRACYDRALRHAPDLVAEVSVGLVIDRFGEPFQIQDAGSTRSPPWLVGCMTAVFETLELPEQSEPTLAKVSLRLQPRQ